MYELISNLRPYFRSLREYDKSIALDLKVPISWRIEHIQQVVSQYKSLSVKPQDKDDKNQLISILGLPTEDGYNTVRNCAVEIINFNIEQEEKEKLFKQKVNELRSLFENQSLDKLRYINFNKEDGQENTTRLDDIKEGD